MHLSFIQQIHWNVSKVADQINHQTNQKKKEINLNVGNRKKGKKKKSYKKEKKKKIKNN